MANKGEIKFMTYNVWCREDVVLYSRMKAIGRLVQQHQPDVICFQVSKLPLKNFARWRFANSPTGRCYFEADIHPEPEAAGKTPPPIRVATAQLEPPTPPAAMHCMERYVQAEHAVSALGSAENVVFGGDMSWDDNTDLPFPLAAGWVDAWAQIPPPPTLSSNAHYGTTCGGDRIDGVDFRGGSVVGPWKRSDRFVCKLKDYELRSLKVISGDTIKKGPVQSTPPWTGRVITWKWNSGPVSGHYGLVLTIGPVGS
ncbi:unnamed protein product [Urochloa decumbens]|uniref:Endonuclease/exonuclease/phosphatase domain-containing protein n=1 Tax=Urochloa decumbens TaxID=240449 RepID=A0ABC9G3R1_9POAL